MNNLEEKLQRIGIGLAPGGYLTPNFEFAKHIRNSIFSFLCQAANISSFVEYFMREKKLYFKDNKALIKRFFNGLLYYLERMDDEFKKDFYAYLLNNDMSKQIVKDTFNVIHKLKHDEKLDLELQKFYRIDNFMNILSQYVRLNEVENQELLEKIVRHTVYKQYLPVSFVELAVLEIFIFRHKRYSDVLIAKVNWKVARKSIFYRTKTESLLDTKNKVNIFDKDTDRLYRKGFSCFRFDFKPTAKTDRKGYKSPIKAQVHSQPTKSPIKLNRQEMKATETINAFRTHRQILDNLK